MFGPYTHLLWIGFGMGSVLGAVAAVVRSRTTPLEGKRWVVALGGVTGAIVGAAVFLGVAILAVMFDHFSDRSNSRELFVPAFLTLVILFAIFVLRRK